VTGARLSIEAPVPPDLTAFWARVSGHDDQHHAC
jgi:hypothetical protein